MLWIELPYRFHHRFHYYLATRVANWDSVHLVPICASSLLSQIKTATTIQKDCLLKGACTYARASTLANGKAMEIPFSQTFVGTTRQPTWSGRYHKFWSIVLSRLDLCSENVTSNFIIGFVITSSLLVTTVRNLSNEKFTIHLIPIIASQAT